MTGLGVGGLGRITGLVTNCMFMSPFLFIIPPEEVFTIPLLGYDLDGILR